MARIAPAEHRRIVVAVTDCDVSMHAAAVAAQLVAQKGELVFVHVLDVPLEFPLDAKPPPGEEVTGRRARDLLARCEAAADRYGVTSRRTVRRCHAAGPAILDTAKRVGASLIVIAGEEQFARSGRMRLGSTATYVLKHSACRVMVISARAAAAAGVAAKVA
jgi:nucleotide-binding universal stress UspA family protein